MALFWHHFGVFWMPSCTENAPLSSQAGCFQSQVRESRSSSRDLGQSGSISLFRQSQFTVSEKVVVCCSWPDAAITVTAEVDDIGPDPPPAPADPPPQPLSSPASIKHANSSRDNIKPRHFLRPKRQRANASAEPEKNRPLP